MALSPIAFIAVNYRDYKNYWLKAYEPSTTTAKALYLDGTGTTSAAKLEINKDGFIESAGGALVTPYIDGAYDAYIFPTEAEADANDTINAERVADNISPRGFAGDSIHVATLLVAVENTQAIEGNYVRISDRGNGLFEYKTGQTNNTYNIVECTGVAGLSLVYKRDGQVKITHFGATEGAGDSTGAIQACIDYVATDGGIVTADSGTYNFTRLIPRSHVIIRGEGSGRTFFNCTDSTTLDDNVTFGSAIRKLDDNTRVSRFAFQDCGIIAEDGQDTFKDIIGLNLCACERGDFRNVFMQGFGYGAIVLSRAQGGDEGLGFVNTAGQDGNYHTFSQMTFASIAEFNPSNATMWLKFKANSNKGFGIFQKGNTDVLFVIENGNDNTFVGGASESSQSIVVLDGELVRSNQFIGFRGEGISGSCYNLLNGCSDNLILPGRMTGIGGQNFNIDAASENLNRISGAGENFYRDQTFPPATDYSSDHNKGVFKVVALNGDLNYPLYVKTETAGDDTNYPLLQLFNDETTINAGQVLGEFAISNRDSSGGAAGISASLRGVAESTSGGTGIAVMTGTGASTLSEKWRFDRLGNFTPFTDGTYDIGKPSNKVGEIFASVGTINTSDAREKTEVTTLGEAELKAAKELSKLIGGYQWLSSIDEKGGNARKHIGLTVQQAIEVMESNGLDAMSYGFICYDEWEDVYEAEFTDEKFEFEGIEYVRQIPTGNTLLKTKAGDRYGFRYDQLAMFVLAGIEDRMSKAGL